MTRRLSFVLAATLTLAACTDHSSSDRLPTNAGAGLYPSMTVVSSHGTTSVTLGLRQVPGGLSFASYQGELSYDPSVLAFQSAALPAGVLGAANLVSPGHIRFAGSSLDGIDGAALLQMRFAATGTVAKEAFSVSLEEVTAASDLADVTAQVRPGVLLFQQR
jgi:hypothetical protein